MTALNALKRSFFVVTSRHNAGQGQFQELKRVPKGSVQIIGLNWNPIVSDTYNSTISSSVWSQSGNTVSLASSTNDNVTSQVTITANGTGTTVLENQVTLANGITLVHYIRVEVIDLNSEVDSVSVPVAGSGIDHGSLTGLTDDDHTQYILHTDMGSDGILARTSSENYTGRTITGATGIAITNGDGISGNPTIDYDINSLTEDASPANGDFLVTYDVDAAGHKKVQLTNLPGGSDTFATIQVDGVAQSTNAPTLDFDGTDFTLTESPTDDFDITIKAERVQDIAGAMFTGNTETGITITYQDADGTIDAVVSDTTVAGDSGSTGITPGDTLTIAGGTEITTAMSGDTLTINADFTPSSTDTVTNKTINTASNIITVVEADISDLQSYLLNVVEDTTPQLGGSLDVNGNKIVSTSSGNIDIEPNGTGNVLLGNFTFDADQSVGAGQDNYVLTYDNGTGLISLESAAAGGDTFASIEVDGVAQSTAAPTLDFDGTDFTLTESPTDDFDITIKAERIQDIVGAMVTGNTETLISVTYQDADGTLDFVVDEASINHDNLTGFVANEHIDWTAASSNFLTSGSITLGTDIIHDGDTNNKVAFGTDTQDFQTGGSSRLDISDSGVRLGGANARVTTVLDEDNMSSNSATSLATQQSIKAYADTKLANVVEDTTPQLGGDLDTNSFHIDFDDAHGIRDDSGNEQLIFQKTTSAVNHIEITNAATSNDPKISAAGDDANIDIDIEPKGTGNVILGNYTLDGDQSVGAGQDNYVLTYDNGSGLISLESAAGGGSAGWVLISSATASSSASVDFTGLSSTYFAYILVFDAVEPATDDAVMHLRMDTDNGASFDSGASDYWWGYRAHGSNTTVQANGDAADAQIVLTSSSSGEGISNAANEGASGQIWIMNPSASEYTQVTSSVFYHQADANEISVIKGGGARLTTTAVDAIQILMDSGNIAQGSFKLYGIVAS